MKTVSVIMPVWNTGEYLREAVESVLSELDGTSGELVIVDDGSDDEFTKSELHRIKVSDPRVLVMSNKSGFHGAGSARNYGVTKASGKWLAFLDSDDVMIKGGLAARLSLIHSDPCIKWLAAEFIEWHFENESISRRYYYERQRRYKVVKKAFDNELAVIQPSPVESVFLDPMPAYTCSVMVRKDVFEEVGGFSNTLQKAEDVFLWMKLAHFVEGYAFIPSPVAKYRIRQDSLNHEDKPMGNWWAELYKAFYKDPEFVSYRSDLRRQISKSYLRDSFYYREKNKSIGVFCAGLNAIIWWPKNVRAWKNIAATLIETLKFTDKGS